MAAVFTFRQRSYTPQVLLITLVVIPEFADLLNKKVSSRILVLFIPH